jgi:hypothetical protein
MGFGPRLLSELVAGSVKGYSNQALSLLAAALGQFARPRHPESLEELRHSLTQIERSGPRPERAPRIRALNTERLLGEDRVRELLARYAAGESASAIGEEFGVTGSSVMRLVHKHGLAARYQTPSDEVTAQTVERYEAGLSLQRLADQFGFSKSAIRRALITVDITLRPPRYPYAASDF